MHTRPALLLALLLGLSLTAACGDNDPIVLENSPDPEPTPDPTPDPMPNMDPGVTPEPTPDPNPDAPPRPSSEVMGGEATGLWEGDVRLLGSVIVPAGQTLTLAADTIVDVVSETERVTIEVAGTLVIDGSATARVAIGSEDGWGGIVVSGTMNGAGLDVSGAERCVLGQMNSDIVLTDATFMGCGASLALANGGTFDRTTIIGGSTIRITGGILRMTDSTVDFGTDGNVPDCTKWDRGGAVLDHVRFTGCHCPLHFNAATEEVSITNSIFDRATYPAMVTQMTGTFTGNHFLGGTNHILDIGGNFDIDIANNYWDGGAPNLSSPDLSQFRGSATFSNTPFPNAGPR